MLKKILIIFYCVFVIFLSYKLRLNNYQYVPIRGSSIDEYSYSWVGLSLIELGYPVGISGLEGYKINDYRYINVDRIFQDGGATSGTPLPINYPWFDHPPLMGLLTGGYAYLKGAKVFEDTIVDFIRKPVVIIGSLNSLLIFIYAYLNYGLLIAIFSSIIYAVSPTVIFSNRAIQAENGYIPLFLLSLIFATISQKKHKSTFWFMACFFAGFSLLFKLSAISISLSLLLLSILNYKKSKNFKAFIQEVSWIIVCLISFVSLFIMYGYIYDSKIYWDIIGSNSSRPYAIGFNFLNRIFITPQIIGNKNIFDPFYVLSWLSVIILIFKNFYKYKYILIPWLSYMTIYVFQGSHPYSWYTFPFFPFIIIALSVIIYDFFKKGNSIFGYIFFLFSFGICLEGLTKNSNIHSLSVIWRMAVPILTFLFIILYKIKSKSKIYYLFFIIIIYLCIKYFYLINNIDYWYKL